MTAKRAETQAQAPEPQTRRFVGSADAEFTPGLSDTEGGVLRAALRVALDEDLAYGPDATSIATVPTDARATADLVSRAEGVLAGVEAVHAVLDEIDPGSSAVEVHVRDGERIAPGEAVATLHGSTRSILSAERTFLNLVCHLSGIASETARWVEAVSGTGARIRDSRKTLPGLRRLQKYAVRAGGGANHRLGLGDAILIKDNHVAAAGGIENALLAVREEFPELPCEVEVDDLDQLSAMLDAGVDLVLLDNFPVWQTQIAVQRRDSLSPNTLLESSGGLSLDTARDYASTGVEYLAVGALTHSVRALDLGLDFAGPSGRT
ncbi:carboxylating nicotinate-nucleotide diphosphorylase [Dietzia sp.]|uniref:carboxylating nicotinate-nucleotide diphosphorylase n=1 Tax=Dietzia sp. TaxID=1871616 RepID=UPI002FDA5669